MKSVLASVFVIFGLSQLFVAEAQSPCPEIFEYANDNNGVYGIITLKPNGRKTTINIRTNFTITTKLHSDYIGNIVPYGGTNAILDYNKGKSIRYRVNFPVSSPLPKVTAIYVNSDLVCSDDPDTLETSDYVTTITLQHTLFIETGSRVRPITIRKPTTQIINYVTDNENRPVYTIPYDDDRTTYYIDTGYGRPVKNQVTRPTIQYYPRDEVVKRPSEAVINDRFREPVRQPIEHTTEPEKKQGKPQPPARDPEPVYDTGSSSQVECGKAVQVPLLFLAQTYSPGQWPWLVAIYQTGSRQLNFVCSGSLISDRHIVTAAHCMNNKDYTNMVVKLGVFNLEEWGGDVVIKKLQSAIVHEQFNKTNLDHDISLFTLEQSVQFNSNIRPICLWGPNNDLNRIVGQTGVVAGWGANEYGTGGRGDPRMLRLPIVSTKDCRASKKDFHGLTSDNTLCAGNRDGSGPCNGDSGSGLYVVDDGRWKLRGIVSHALASLSAEKRCNLDEYVVFTDAAKYTRWIQKYMQF